LSVPFVGMIADRVGIDATLVALALVPLVAAACTLPLPADARAADAPTERQPVEAGAPDSVA
jgi:hypothetical protein